ncbi:glucoamylase family protein [Nitrosovibrio sp. Nv4]|uniref:glucoamylase family protein n=1 Tax=Nitrosovibrio sp. Nv4 TaxID=1945880 RepID=UPI000BE3FDA1|nr:glucoamylase family protein [Nitrosovibrio sp. Nv4]
MLISLQQDSFAYFVHKINPANGLVLDKSHSDWPASIAAVGLALAAYPVGVERGFMTREEAVKRTLIVLKFFANAPHGPERDATGYKGFYYHFLDMNTGKRVWNCELSSVDTAFLIAGMLIARAYYKHETEEEGEIRKLADELYRRVDWQWMQKGEAAVSHGWTPEKGFLPYQWTGYDEALILYLLGLGSPTHPLSDESYAAWTSTYKWKKIYDIEFLYAGPLFIHQLSHAWIDFRGIRDSFMRERGSDYFENSRCATLVQQRYAARNPLEFKHYNEYCWGITSSDGPGPVARQVDGILRVFYDYIGRGAPYGPDDGTLAPWAVVASLPFAPDIVLPTIENYERMNLREAQKYGYKATFNPTFPVEPYHEFGWVSPYHFGLNQGPIVMMIENYRSGLLWSLMRQCPYLVTGLRRAGFRGGWLEG